MFKPLKTSVLYTVIILGALLVSGLTDLSAASKQDQEFWEVSPRFDQFKPGVVAVLPMDNFSLEPELEEVLYNAAYEQLQAKGYRRVSVGKAKKVMKDLGVQTPGQLQGISLKRLGDILNTDAVLLGQVDQAASIHKVTFDAVVVSCSLKLIDCESGELLWRSEQWRTAHRQWQMDPFNALINVMAHSSSSRSDRIAWLVQEMLRTLPMGKVRIETDNLLNQAMEINANAE
jgi:hypothetical protein